MSYTATRRLYHMAGRKTSKYMMYKKAKRMCNEINSRLSLLEHRFLRSRLNHI